MVIRTLLLLLLLMLSLTGQDPNSPDPDVRADAAEELARRGAEALPQLEKLLKDPVDEVRVEAVKAIVKIGGLRTLEPLIEASRDNDAEVQIRATDGLVNFYMPGYAETGLTASLRRAGKVVRSRWVETNDQVIPANITARADVIEALGKLVRGGINMEVRANAARAVGILRGKAAVPDLVAALRTKDDRVLYESVIALQKIGDPEAAPEIMFLLRDFNERVQIAALETTGLLQNRAALPGLRDALNRARSDKVRRAALTAIAMLPDEANRATFESNLNDRDAALRAAAAEGIGRLAKPDDLPKMEALFNNERNTSARLSQAFALVLLGKTVISEFSPLQYLVNSLNSRSYRGVAQAFLVELSRKPDVRNNLYPVLSFGTTDEKMHLLQILARSGDAQTIPYLEKAAKDSNPEIARESLRALQILKARI